MQRPGVGVVKMLQLGVMQILLKKAADGLRPARASIVMHVSALGART